MSKQHRGAPVLSVTIHDCELQTFAAGGPGGQKQNTSNTAIRIVHRPSGARGESREERSQLQNKRAAFVRMANTLEFRKWMARKLANGPSPEERVERDMQREKLRVERDMQREKLRVERDMQREKLRVERDMQREKLRVEVRDNGHWQVLDD